MRSPTGGMPAKLAQNCGTESIVLVEIQWVDGGQRFLYADRSVAGSGQIVEIGSIDSTANVDGSTDSSQVQLILEDTDGRIKALCDTYDLHKRPVWVYQWFDGLSLSDKMLLFKGEINSPFTWNEGDRTVSFDVTTKIEDVEAGFSMEEGDFPVVPPDALGKAWPLVFGSVCDVKAVQVRAPRYGILQSGEMIRDYTLESRICQARHIQCANVPLGESDVVTGDTPIVFQPGVGGSSNQTVMSPEWLESRPHFQIETTLNWGPDQSCVEDRFFTICNLLYQLQQQVAYEHPTMTILGATALFPQGEHITINIEGGKFTGYFTGDVFTIENRAHPDLAMNPPSLCHPVDDRSFEVKQVLETGAWRQGETGASWYDSRVVNGAEGGANLDPQDFDDWCDREIQSQLGRQSVDGPVDSRKAFDDMATASFFWARAGSKVFLEAEAEVLFIVNLLPCTITRVAAMKQTQFGPKLMTVPAEFYTIYETDYDGYTVTEIGMTKPLSQRSELVTNPDGTTRVVASKWSDNLYVTLTSSVGPNPVDIIEWLIGKYTSLSADSTSFDHVRTRLTNYPSQFALLERKNVMELIADVATQSRCVVCVRDDTIYLKYASEEPTAVAAITESDVLVNTLKITLSSTDDVATKHDVTWSRSQSEGELKVILKHNVAKYGTHAKDWNYYTQNIFENVLKSATFWMIRYANAWKLVEFSAPLKHLALEVFDCVTLNLPDVSAPVKAIITSVRYDIENEQIAFTCWTPLKAGESEPYIHAWPADIVAGTIFPTASEREADVLFTVAPPVGHLLYVEEEPDGNPSAIVTSGDPHPSDLDDTLGTCHCPATDDAIIDEPDPVILALKKAQRSGRDAQQSKIDAPAAAGGVNDKKKKPDLPCGHVGTKDCVYTVTVIYMSPALVGVGNGGCAGPCIGAGTGIVCTSMTSTVCHSFSDLGSALMFSHQMKELAESLKHDCGSGLVLWGTSGVSIPAFVASPVGHGDCTESSPGSLPGSGETREPRLVS